MSSMVMKMIADMAGISPEDIAATIGDMQKLAADGLSELQSINDRLARLEEKFGIESPVCKDIPENV